MPSKNNEQNRNGEGNRNNRDTRSASLNQDFDAFVSQMSACTVTMRNLNRKERMVWICRICAYGLLIGDAYFSFWAMTQAGRNAVLAFIAAVAIGCVQWAVATCLFDRSVGALFEIDVNKDGKIAPWEWVRIVFIVVAAAFVYYLDAATNSLGVDRVGLGNALLFPFANPAPWQSEAATWILSIFLMMADETIHVFLDPIQRHIDTQKPITRRRYAKLQAQEREVTAYRQAMIERAEEVGRKRGEREEL